MDTQTAKLLSEMRQLLPSATQEQRMRIMQLVTETVIQHLESRQPPSPTRDYIDEK